MTITKERLLKIQHWRETYGADSNVMLPAEEAEELARIALAALEAEKGADPVVFTDERNLRHIASGRETSLIWGKQNQEVGDIPLYRHAQPVPVDKEFIPKNLDKALGVVGVALPESKEEFNFQIERWIQRLIDRVIRYADEFKEHPAPVVPEEMPAGLAGQIISLLAHNIGDKFLAQKIWNACRAAMLQAEPVTTANKLGNSQVHSDCCQEQSPIDHGYRPECECSGCKATARICAELTGNSPVIPEGLVKAVHFYEQAKRENPPIETGVWKDAIDWVLKEACLAVSTLESSREHEVISQQEKA
ncbi:TPA: DUF551 domain-containing protein [Salmonella enterica subsp. enterica serovar Virchow]